MEMGGGGGGSSSESHLLQIGLKFGEEIYFEDVGGKSEGGFSPAADGGGGGGDGGGGPPKKGRTQVGLGGQGQQMAPRCQVEGCNLDLSDAKTYYSRHKVCGVHSKTPKVIVNGLEQRFCQQCSRFHQLPEFDQGKRSCRRRLAGHNERRRKPTSGSLLSARYGSLPPSIFESNGNGGSFLMDFSSCPRPPPHAASVHWPTSRAPPRAANTLPAATEKFPPLPWQSSLDNPPPYINPNVPPGGCFDHDNNCALSLLSNHSSGSTNQTLSLEYYLNPDASAGGGPMVQPPSGTMGHGHFSTATTGWGYEANEAHLGLGQIPHPGYSGELGLGQQGGRRYDSASDHIDWSL